MTFPRLHPSRLRRWLAAAPPATAATVAEAFCGQARRFTLAQTLVRVFYAFLLYLAVTQLPDLSSLSLRPTFSPLWPVTWVAWHGTSRFGTPLLLAFYLVTNLGAVFLAPFRWGRLAVFLGLLEYVALKNSFGKIGHSLHLPLLAAGVFVLLPPGWSRPAETVSRRARQTALLVFWLAQAAVLMSYTMSGAGKLGGALWQAAHGQANAFTPGALGAHIAQRLVQTHSDSLLGGWIIRHPLLTWPAMPAAVYLELFALLAAFRPGLGRAWAGALLGFHAGTYFTMTISFPQSCFLLAMFFFPSPFEPATVRWQTLLGEVPLVGTVWKKIQASSLKLQERAKTQEPEFKAAGSLD